MFEACGVEPAKFRAISSAVDKLDKVKIQILYSFFFLGGGGGENHNNMIDAH